MHFWLINFLNIVQTSRYNHHFNNMHFNHPLHLYLRRLWWERVVTLWKETHQRMKQRKVNPFVANILHISNICNIDVGPHSSHVDHLLLFCIYNHIQTILLISNDFIRILMSYIRQIINMGYGRVTSWAFRKVLQSNIFTMYPLLETIKIELFRLIPLYFLHRTLWKCSLSWKPLR